MSAPRILRTRCGVHTDQKQPTNQPIISRLRVPIVNTIRATSEAARAGLRSGMRIIGVGKTTIRPSHRMPSSAKDYSPDSKLLQEDDY
jgi:predicted metalloprotease with PDZ domain